jgi:tetratricopeptide (TPR) repeat protein
MYASLPTHVLPVVTCAGVAHPLEEVKVSPEQTQSVELPDSLGSTCAVALRDSAGNTILEYNPNDDDDVELPDSAETPPAPIDVPTVEQLYLIGIHLEQNRHASWNPDDYFAQALHRDRFHVQSNIAMARRSIYRNLADDAHTYAQRAVERLCRWNTNPESGWAHYYLGVAESMKKHHAAARRAFEKASWSADARHAALYELAARYVVDGDLIQAIRLLNECLSERPRFERALALRHIAYRKTKNETAAAESRAADLAHNPLSYIAAVEEHFFHDDCRNWKHVWQTVLGEQNNRFIDVLCEYSHVGGGDEIATLCREYATLPPQQLSPLPFFIAAHAARDPAERAKWRRKAESAPWVGAFPVRLETLHSLESAAVGGPGSALAHFLLGTAEYDRGNHHRAYTHWSSAAETISDNPTLYRNIALYQFNQREQPEEALGALARAVELAPTDGRLLLELDELRKRLRYTPEQRRAELAERLDVIDTRDDLVVRYSEMLTSTGRPQDAIQRFSTRQFHPWEGGEGVVTGAYRRALIQSALHSFASGEPQKAITLLTRATEYPPNLGEGRLPNTADNEINFWMGVIHSHTGNSSAAETAFRAGTEGESTPSLSMYYNDVPARAILYQGLSWRRSGNEKNARRCFHSLRDHADRHEQDIVAPDYFAVSLPDLVAFDYDLSERNRLFCRTIRGLSLVGLGAAENARIQLEAVLRDDPNSQDAIDHLNVLTTEILAEAVSWS